MMQKIEHNLQVSCRVWFDMQYPAIKPLLYSVPNGGLRNMIVAKQMKDEGLRKGVPDMMLAIPNDKYCGLGIEFKKIQYKLSASGNMTKIKGVQSEEQKTWQQLYEKAGGKYIVIYTIEEFIEEVTNYLRSSQLTNINA